jgi:cell division protein FtsQ
MQGKKIIWKVLMIAGWLVAGAGIIALLAAANRKQEKHICKEVLVLIKGSSDQLYIDRADVMKLLLSKDPLISRSISSIDLSALEESLKAHKWIAKAELYFDSRDALHVSVTERVPIARVFTTTGSSFYFDSTAHQMPLLQDVSLRLPVITNFTASKKWTADDSAFAKKMIRLVNHVNADPFWSAQVAQINITPERKIEMIPVVGNHLLKLGYPDDVENKLKNLFLFYNQVLYRSGITKYSEVSAEYSGQVIGVLKGSASAVDSIQLKKNIDALMNLNELQWIDTARSVPVITGQL